MIKKTGNVLIIIAFLAILSPLFYMSDNIFTFLIVQSYGPILLLGLGLAFAFGRQDWTSNILPVVSISLLFSVFTDSLSLYLQPQINGLAQHSSTQNLAVSVSKPTLSGIIIMLIFDFFVTYVVSFLFVFVANKFLLFKNKVKERG
ncbi:hypothetical protein [Weissella bombi]|uniref:Uncharacterized protein n=1 Tax=Weissella bombi TaxID=1505725 RepID=A0A1C3ZQL9_9LACO|nr:hypothetical protein [Weissella bombi]SCB84591.1 hypothetical protein GA0061074_102145 [Weissella bombi]